MLPDVTFEVAALLVEYIYGDNVFTRLDPSSDLPLELARAAERYGLPRLRRICVDASVDGDEEAVMIADAAAAAARSEGDVSGEAAAEGSGGGDLPPARAAPTEAEAEEAFRKASVVPPSTLGADLGLYCVDNERWADVRLVTSSGVVVFAPPLPGSLPSSLVASLVA